MAKVVKRSLALTNPETGEYVTLEPGDTIPAWGDKLVTNPKAFTEAEGVELPKQLGAVDAEKRQAANAPAEVQQDQGGAGIVSTGVTVVGGDAEQDGEGDESETSGEGEAKEPTRPSAPRAKEAPARKA